MNVKEIAASTLACDAKQTMRQIGDLVQKEGLRFSYTIESVANNLIETREAEYVTRGLEILEIQAKQTPSLEVATGMTVMAKDGVHESLNMPDVAETIFEIIVQHVLGVANNSGYPYDTDDSGVLMLAFDEIFGRADDCGNTDIVCNGLAVISDQLIESARSGLLDESADRYMLINGLESLALGLRNIKPELMDIVNELIVDDVAGGYFRSEYVKFKRAKVSKTLITTTAKSLRRTLDSCMSGQYTDRQKAMKELELLYASSMSHLALIHDPMQQHNRANEMIVKLLSIEPAYFGLLDYNENGYYPYSKQLIDILMLAHAREELDLLLSSDKYRRQFKLARYARVCALTGSINELVELSNRFELSTEFRQHLQRIYDNTQTMKFQYREDE